MVTKDSKLQWLQFRISHRIIATNSYLFQIKYKDSDKCSFCNREKETIIHLFWDCIFVNPLWGEFRSWYIDKCSEYILLNGSDVIFGKVNVSVTLNLLILLVKCYIYTQRVNERLVAFSGFLSYLKHYQRIEKSIYFRKNDIDSFHRRMKNCILI